MEFASQCRRHTHIWRPGFDPWCGKIPWRRKWQPTPVILPEKSHGQRSLVGYSPWSHERVRHDSATGPGYTTAGEWEVGEILKKEAWRAVRLDAPCCDASLLGWDSCPGAGAVSRDWSALLVEGPLRGLEERDGGRGEGSGREETSRKAFPTQVTEFRFCRNQLTSLLEPGGPSSGWEHGPTPPPCGHSQFCKQSAVC